MWDLQTANTALFLLCAALVTSLMVIGFLIYTIKKKSCDCWNGNRHYLFVCLFICNQPIASFILNVSVFQTGSDGDQQGQQVKLKKLMF